MRHGGDSTAILWCRPKQSQLYRPHHESIRNSRQCEYYNKQSTARDSWTKCTSINLFNDKNST